MISIRELVKVYPGPVAALQGVTLTIPKGMFGLLGPNGSGKTTLMRILAGLLEPTSGTISFDGVDVTNRPELVWPRLGHLPQDFGFYPNLTGRAMLMHVLRLKGVDAPQGLDWVCDALLDRVNLTDAANRKTKAYSGGMKRRLGIAQAIAGDPDLLIVDEPTAGLDPEERLRFSRLLTELADDRTVLLSTHIVEDVATLCPRLAVIRKGRLLAQTTPGDARRELEGHMYRGILERDALEALAAQEPSAPGLDTDSPDRTVTKAHLIEGQNVARVYSPAGPPGSEFRRTEPTLEDAYLLHMRNAERADPVGAGPS